MKITLNSFNYSEVLDYIKNYLPEHKGESEFLDNYCSAAQKLSEAVNKTEQEKDLSISDLEEALKYVEECCNSTDPLSQWVNATGLKEIITNTIQSISGLE